VLAAAASGLADLEMHGLQGAMVHSVGHSLPRMQPKSSPKNLLSPLVSLLMLLLAACHQGMRLSTFRCPVLEFCFLFPISVLHFYRLAASRVRLTCQCLQAFTYVTAIPCLPG
jgi:hypothetical protein